MLFMLCVCAVRIEAAKIKINCLLKMALSFFLLLLDGCFAISTDTCDLTGVWTGSFKKRPTSTHGVYNIVQHGDVWNASSGGTEGWKTAGGVVQAKLGEGSSRCEPHTDGGADLKVNLAPPRSPEIFDRLWTLQ